jgi:5-methylcytosine-specific restriction endonuclease McrA
MADWLGVDVSEDTPASKRCTKCGEDKPLNEYHPQRDGKYGIRGDCRVCVNVARRAKNSSGPRAQARAAERPGFKCCNRCWEVKPVGDFALASGGLYGVRGDCRECQHAAQAERNRKRYASDLEYRARRLAENARQRAEHPEAVRECQQRYYRKNREAVLAYSREWSRQNNLKRREYSYRQVAKRWGCKVGSVDLAAVVARYTACYLCGRDLAGSLDFDHVIPFSQGGPHIESNIRPTHRTCNRQKHARTPDQLPEGWLKL